MSNLLNRVSLELVNLETDVKYEKKKKNRPKSVLDLIPANHRIVKSKKKSELPISSHQYRKIRIHRDKKRLDTNKDSIEDNIHKLLLLSSNHLDVNTADKLFNRAVKKQPISQVPKPEEERTAFTEEDFKKFADEYMNS